MRSAARERRTVWFVAPGEVEVRAEPLPAPGRGEVTVATEVSAISPGTEMLVYRGLLPEGIALDATIPSLAAEARYPLRYGYAAVGRVEALGDAVDRGWLGRRVFAFQPHVSRFVTATDDLVPIPGDLASDAAALLPTVETAVNLLLDGRPMIGERVAVYGQGIVGLATTALLRGVGLAALVTLDRHPRRRELSCELGATACLDPAAAESPELLSHLLGHDEGDPTGGADLVYELSGSPDALGAAIAQAGFAGRIVVGSWYGRKPVELDLGSRFHRHRLRLVSSQVSTIAPEHQGRWTPRRRLATALRELARLPIGRLVTHRFAVGDAAEAYRLLAERPAEAVQVLLTYSAPSPA